MLDHPGWRKTTGTHVWEGGKVKLSKGGLLCTPLMCYTPLSRLDLLLLLLLLLWAANLLGRSLHLLLLHLLLLHWQWAEEHLLHLAHWKTAAHWGAQGRRPNAEQHGRQLL